MTRVRAAHVGSVQWNAWRARLSHAPDLASLRRVMGEIADEMAGHLPEASVGLHQWRRLGVHVRRERMHAAGRSFELGNDRFVIVADTGSPPSERDRFTVAHELGHLLLDPVLRERDVRVPHDQRERLCDAFASRLLLPDEHVEQALAAFSRPIGVAALNRLAGDLRVNYWPLMLALARQWPDDGTVAVYATRRGHPRRPSVVDLRVETQAGGPLFLARHRRLRSLGLTSLADWADAGGEWQQWEGEDHLTVTAWQRSATLRSGTAEGPVRWEAIRTRRRTVLAVLDITQVGVRWYNPLQEHRPT